MSRARFVVALRALAQRGRYPVSSDVATELDGHSAKHVLPNVARARCEPKPVVNEVGKWSGSVAQLATASAAAPPSHGEHPVSEMGDRYSQEAADEIVPAIIERQVAAVRRLVTRVGGAEHLPHSGGWSLLEPVAQEVAAASLDAIVAALAVADAPVA